MNKIFQNALPHIKNFDVALDVGAHKGLYSKDLKELGFKTVIAFEPNIEKHQEYYENLKGYSNVYLFATAVGNPKVSNRGSLIAGEFYKNDKMLKVQEDGNDFDIISIDSLRLEACDFIKVDVEGYELRVFEGAVETLKEFSPVIAVEVADWSRYERGNRYGTTPKKTLEYLSSLGYKPKIRSGIKAYDYIMVKE